MWTTIIMSSKTVQIELQTQIGIGSQSEELYIHKNQLSLSTIVNSIATVPSLTFFLLPFSQRIPHIIKLLLNHLHLTLVDRLRYHLSTCPIRHISWLFVSCDGQDFTVQMSFPHKCDQESGYSAFNAVVVAFPQIFLCLFPSSMFIRHVFIF